MPRNPRGPAFDPGPASTTIGVMSDHEDRAVRLAGEAANRAGEEKLTDAIGEGLAAVAFALLDVAAAIRELAQKD